MWKTYPKQPSNSDEYIALSKALKKSPSHTVFDYLFNISPQKFADKQSIADHIIKNFGITFSVYSEGEGTIDRSWPFDIIPRIMLASEWATISTGLTQRLKALNHFIDDVYHDGRIFKAGVLDKELVYGSANYRSECQGMNLAYDTWAHICGTDLIRDKDGQMFVLEDNLRVPSGVSYMLENRQITKRVFPDLFSNANIMPVGDYPSQLYDILASLSPRQSTQPEIVVLTPGIYNSAYFEHTYLAMQMGCELVEGRDLVVDDEKVYMRTIYGFKQVDVIYRRVDDLYLDPITFNKDSTLGVKGLMAAWRAGNVAIANAPGAGVADDKVIYAYVPEMIRYYLGEEQLIENVPTYRCIIKSECDYVLNNLENMVVKPANESGGYGMLMGPQSTKAEQEEYKQKIKANPRNFIAQPVIDLSTVPTVVNNADGSASIRPRHVDLRPFILSAQNNYVTTGGLTRVALREGSLIVNSSQGGGSKDTVIIQDHLG